MRQHPAGESDPVEGGIFMDQVDHDAIIVGGGHNGLVAAAYLAAAGMDVLLLERRHLLGGACVTEELFPGYRFSACSYICHLLQAKVIDDLELRRYGFEVFPLDPERFQPFADGRRLLVWDDVERTQEEIGRFSRRDAESYPRWLAFWKRAAAIIHPHLLRPPPGLGEIAARARRAGDEAFLERLLKVSMKEVVCSFFESEPVRGTFVHAHDVGDPGAPGSAWCYAYIKCNLLGRARDKGIVKGGMGGITRAMARAARARGAVLREGVEVERVLVEDGRAAGVALSDGTGIRARVVVSNADPKRTFLKLVGRGELGADFADRVERLQTRAAYLKFHAALSALPDFSSYFDGDFDPRYLAEGKICPSIAYLERCWDEARRGELARSPVMEVQIPSGYDPGMAPPGHHVMSVWALYAPVRLRRGRWEDRRREAGESLIDTLSAFAPNLREVMVDWSLFTPADMERRVGLTDGNIRHLDIVPDQFLANRPLAGWADYRTPIANLYLCGAGTHPGGEVTGAPGHNAAAAILRDCGAAGED